MELVITSLRLEADGVLGVELRDRDGEKLPEFAPGAHIDVTFPNGLTRQYSISSSASDRARYWLGIGRAKNSRGGSSYAHEKLRIGDSLQVSEPRSLFGLEEDAVGHLFVAGGIGITPILSMIFRCVERGYPWRLLYCVRSRRSAAYLEVLEEYEDHLLLHADEEHEGKADVAAALSSLPPGWHVYTCGPGAMIDAVRGEAKSAGKDGNAIHWERFFADTAAPAAPVHEFNVRLLRHGGSFAIPENRSILEVLEENGVCLPYSCREGLCRSCEVQLVSGEAEHRDYVLSEEERYSNHSILICVSRARCSELVLDV
ncbi:PDR/VanB family oxidoreductase [Cupriavidus oxalaticus]|uniref:Oxidoreductase n=1 Tax=Cupriavidus oxalaticus TaxID=96344 RepID=A0A4P7LP26_9BURK|nr:PDR/VanB family oxidoreductase [Cupriavidus oxalaticus]QBY55453.1 oxidoreductase [Cupriavidus oxalaticus]